MAIGVVGRKVGMTRVFTEAGETIPVTVIEVEPNRVTQVRTPEVDGYSAIQVTTGEQKASRVNKPEAGQMVDVRGVTKGKGYQGPVKRYNFATQDATHGNSLSHRAPGSIGQRQTPGRVFKGKRMAGHMGNVNRTAVNLEVVRVDAERNLLLVRGAVPGAPGGDLIVTPAAKVKG